MNGTNGTPHPARVSSRLKAINRRIENSLSSHGQTDRPGMRPDPRRENNGLR